MPRHPCFAMVSLAAGLLAFSASLACGGASPVGEGQLSCDAGCPEGWTCHSDSRCYSTPQSDSDVDLDDGISHTGPDASDAPDPGPAAPDDADAPSAVDEVDAPPVGDLEPGGSPEGWEVPEWDPPLVEPVTESGDYCGCAGDPPGCATALGGQTLSVGDELLLTGDFPTSGEYDAVHLRPDAQMLVELTLRGHDGSMVRPQLESEHHGGCSDTSLIPFVSSAPETGVPARLEVAWWPSAEGFFTYASDLHALAGGAWELSVRARAFSPHGLQVGAAGTSQTEQGVIALAGEHDYYRIDSSKTAFPVITVDKLGGDWELEVVGLNTKGGQLLPLQPAATSQGGTSVTLGSDDFDPCHECDASEVVPHHFIVRDASGGGSPSATYEVTVSSP